jgi:gamma-glutamyltranspeptidase/glutathione hydrolase
MQWKLLFEDSIKLSTEGFVVGKRLSKLTSRAPHLKNQNTAREYFNIDNGGLQEGKLKKNLKFANTLKLIRDNGSKAMLTGELADNIFTTVSEHKNSPGLMIKKDFSFVKPVLNSPICGKYRKWKICGMGPPSSGGITVLQILGILNNFELSSNNPNDPEVWHLFLEAAKLAYTDRGYYIADDDFIDVPIEFMLDEKYLKERSELIKKNSIISNPQKGKFNNDNTKYLGIDSTSEKPSTTHLSILDKYGNALALTSSIEFMFGSGLMTSGFLLNNQMTDFSFYPNDKEGNLIANRPEGKKKPRSSMSPTLVFDNEGELRMILGSPGGSQIICYVAASLVRVIDLNIKPENITEQPNICNRGFKSDIELGVIGDILTKELENKGHKINRKNMTSGIHMIYKDNAKKLYGIADQRREGTAYGL